VSVAHVLFIAQWVYHTA